jgi:glucosamine 6-phosphate synthetase-like amidotransferase/phosphosugar isomerase protein
MMAPLLLCKTKVRLQILRRKWQGYDYERNHWYWSYKMATHGVPNDVNSHPHFLIQEI